MTKPIIKSSILQVIPQSIVFFFQKALLLCNVCVGVMNKQTKIWARRFLDFQAHKLVYLCIQGWKPIDISSVPPQVYLRSSYFYMLQNHEQSPQAAAHHHRSRQPTVISSSGSSELQPRERGKEQPHLRGRENQLQPRGRPAEESDFRGREEVHVRRAQSVSSLLLATAAARPGFDSLAGQGRRGESGTCRLQRDFIPFKRNFFLEWNNVAESGYPAFFGGFIFQCRLLSILMTGFNRPT